MTMHCPNELQLQSMADGEVRLWEGYFLKRHLSACEKCRLKVAEFSQIHVLLHTAFPGPRLTVAQPKFVYAMLQKKVALAAIALVVLFAITSFWYRLSQPSLTGPESEMVEEYLTIHYESGS